MNVEDRRIPEGIGMMDTRPQMSVIQGRRFGVPEPRLISPKPLDIIELTAEPVQRIEQSWDDVEKVDRIKRAIEAISMLNLADHALVRSLLAHFLMEETGNRAVAKEFLGTASNASINSLIDRVENDEDAQAKAGIVNFLVDDVNLSILKGKLAGKTHREIAIETGKTKRRVDFIGRGILLAGLIAPTPANAEKSRWLRMYCDEVKVLVGKGLSIGEIAVETDSAEYQVHDAIVLMNLIGETQARSNREILNRRVDKSESLRAEIKRLVSLGYKINDVSKITGEPIGRIRYQLDYMRRRKDGPRFLRNRNQTKVVLLAALMEYAKKNPGKRVSLSKIRTDPKVRLSKQAANSAYWDLVKAGVNVPPIKNMRGNQNPK